MLQSDTTDVDLKATATDADDAVGVEKRYWFIAIVLNKSEKKSADILASMGYEVYVASQQVSQKLKNGRKKIVSRIVLPAILFVKATEKERRKHLVFLPFIKRFMVDRARKKSELGQFPVACVPENQMEVLQFMLNHSDAPVSFTPTPFKKGDCVRVCRGSLSGLQGRVALTENNRSRIYVELDILGCACVELDSADLVYM